MALQTEELLALQAVDTRLGRLDQEKAALDHGERVERALASRSARLAQAERRLLGLQTEARNNELELAGLEEKKHVSSKKLYEGRITAPRELQALEMEIAMMERQRGRLSDTILRGMDEVERAKEAVATAQAAVDEAEKALKVVKRRYDKEAARIEAEMATLQPERGRLSKILDTDMLRRYDDIRRRQHNVAAVRVVHGACGGCKMKVGAAVLRRMATKDSYIYCESCSRILFPPAD